jgi:hypothetical protein
VPKTAKVPEVPQDFFGHELLYFVLFGQDMLFWLSRTAGRGVRRSLFGLFVVVSSVVLGRSMLDFVPGNA